MRIFKPFSLKSIQNFFKVRGEDGKLDGDQIWATVVQTALVLAFIYALYLMGLFS